MDIVSFETAKKLKEAGFPQPEYIALGFGYTDDGVRFYIEECHFPNEGIDGICFAPTATDILRQMPDYAIAFDDSQRPHGFTCYDAMRRQPQLKQFWTTHENPAEAAAEMYLSLNATEFEMKITGKLNDTVND